MTRMSKRIAGLIVLAVTVLVLVLPSASSAHEGHDDGAKKAAVAADSGMIARTVRVGDYEVMMKHPALEPLHEHSARLFITRYASNEPIKEATANLIIAAKGKEPIKVAAKPSARAGEYELTLPPLDSGNFSFSVIVKTGGVEQTADYGAVTVETLKTAAVASNLADTGNALLWSLGVLLLTGVGVTSYRVWHRHAILQPES